MGILVNLRPGPWRIDKYRLYLETIREKLPKSAYKFASAAWHFNPNHPRCPHDGRVKQIKISVLAKGRNPPCRTQVEIVLIGAYHDRLLKFTYRNVTAHSIESKPSRPGYGDWLIDEIRLSQSGRVLHEILFWHNTMVKIECDNLIFQEQLTSSPYSTEWLER